MSIFENPYEKAFIDAVLHAAKGGIAVMLMDTEMAANWIPRRLSVNHGVVLVVTDNDVEQRLAGVNATGLFVASAHRCDKRAIEVARSRVTWYKDFAYNTY